MRGGREGYRGKRRREKEIRREEGLIFVVYNIFYKYRALFVIIDHACVL